MLSSFVFRVQPTIRNTALALVFGLTGTSFAQQPGIESKVQREVARREAIADGYARETISKGNTALKEKDYESAFAYFKSAVDTLPNAPQTAELRNQALNGFCDAAIKLAEQRISEGRFADASSTVAVILDEQYAPGYQPALVLQERLRSPDYYNKTLTPQFLGRVEEVKQLLLEADGLYQSGRYDAAFNRYQQILNIDPYNIAARRGMERVNNQKEKYFTAAHNESRARMLEQVDANWALPVPKYDIGNATIVDQPPIDVRATESIQRKLDSIIVPRIKFTDASIPEALDYLRNRVEDWDVNEPDPAKKGVNFFLKLDTATAAGDVGPLINMELSNVPLKEVLRVFVEAANLKMKIEPHAVAIVPLSEPTDVLLVKEFNVNEKFTRDIPEPAAAGGFGGGAIAAQSSVRTYLEDQGIRFPQGASANLLRNRGKLIVKNTQENLDLIDLLLQSDAGSYTQVEIETKFIEINQNNLKELGFDWLVGQFALLGGSGVYGSGGTSGNQAGNSSVDYPLLNQSGQAIGLNPANNTGQITAGNRTGGAAIQANAIDALLYGGPTGPAAGVLSLAGVFTNPQFQVVIRALNQMKGADLMSAPKVVARNAESASIQIIREFIYPTEFQPPELPTSTGSQLTPVTPTTPTEFATQNLGVELTVTPNVEEDLTSIALRLEPKVTEFDGFINFGSPIDIIAATGIAVPSGDSTIVLLGPSAQLRASDNTINQPIFSVRSIETNVTIFDGQTVALGGLINENIQKVEDKTPFLGDIPLVGRLFRSSADQHTKKNLMIFVTATIIDRAGQPLVQEIENGQESLEPSSLQVANEMVAGDALSAPSAPIPSR